MSGHLSQLYWWISICNCR